MTAPRQTSRRLEWPVRLWNSLTEPSASITDFETRFKSRWMATIIVVFIPLGLVIVSMPALIAGRLPWEDPQVWQAVALFAFLSVSYYFSRCGRYRLSAILAISAATLVIYSISLGAADIADMIRDSTYLTAIVIFSSMMLSLKSTVAILIVNGIGLLLLPLFRPELRLADMVVGPFALLVMTFALVAFGVYLRDALETHHEAILKLENAERRRAETSLRTSLDEKEVLLREIHHRVKNNLQIISSLLNLQSMNFSDPVLLAQFQDSQNRVRSMALIHERLYRSEDLALVDFSTYLRELTGSLVMTYSRQPQNITVTVDADAVMLDIDTAIPCGLIVNELVSNALKHGFPSGRAGQIQVEMFPEPQFRLVVSDDGIGLPPDFDWRHSPSLGLQLVESLTRQLGGTIEISGSPGTRAEICFSRPVKREKDMVP